MNDRWKRFHHHGKNIWHFIWEEDSLWSWLAYIIIALLVILYIVYPLLGYLLGTSFPIVAVISESMDHGLHTGALCGQGFDEFHESFDNYWNICGGWYDQRNISKEEFSEFPFRDGFRKGDIIVLWKATTKNVNVGDILVFKGSKQYPVIHRVVLTWQEDEHYYFQTKGDHNRNSMTGPFGETQIEEKRFVGKGVIRIPYLGWLKIIFVDAVKPLGINIQR